MTLDAVAPEPVDPESAAGGGGESGKPRRNWEAKVIKGLKRAQKYSAIGIAAFAGLHLTATVALPVFSTDIANSAFMAGRSVYQNELGEAVLVYGSFGIHVVSGLLLHAHRIYRRYRDFGIIHSKKFLSRINFGNPSATALSGLALTVLTALHFLVNRVGPIVKLGDSSLISLDYISHSLQRTPLKSRAALLLLAFFYAYHALAGAWQIVRLKISRPRKWALVLGFSVLTSLSLSALAKRPVTTGWLADQFDLAHSII